MKSRQELLDGHSPAGLEVFQLTEEPVPSSHIYMEAPIFTPDSKRLVLHRSATAHGGNRNDPEHRYLLCDLENGGALSPLTEETGATAPAVTPDGRTLYYFVDQTAFRGGRLTLKRVGLDGTGRETVLAIEDVIPGTRYAPTRIYPLSTISTDGGRIALPCYMGDGEEENAPWGLLVFEVARGTVRLILQGQTWCNLHPQYSRNPARSHDLMIQENHGNVVNKDGVFTTLVSGRACDIHLIRDDGEDFRDFPWGRDGDEMCQGHQCWRGRTDWAITSTGHRRSRRKALIEGQAAPHAFHTGILTPGARRNELTRDLAEPRFDHFSTDLGGRRMVSDFGSGAEGYAVTAADLGEPGHAATGPWVHLLNTRSTGVKESHVHPFLAPDGRAAFFNSDETGRLQAYMIRGLDAALGS